MNGQSEREVKRRALIEYAKDAVKRANECTVVVSDVQKKHNALAEQTAKDVKAITRAIEQLQKLRRLDVELAGQREVAFLAFTRMQTFWQRVRWFSTSHWSSPDYLPRHEVGPTVAPPTVGIQPPASDAPLVAHESRQAIQ
jgi:hypothetical protein